MIDVALISVNTLRRRMAEHEDLVVCDVRYSLSDPSAGRRAFDEGHLPGAVFVDLHNDLADVGRGGGRHPLPEVSQFAEVLGRIGLGPDQSVVAYDASGGAFAARLWWMLRAVGHRDVRVLDGGFPAWVAEGGPVTTEVIARQPTHYPVPDRWSGVTDADGVTAALGEGRLVVEGDIPVMDI